MFHYWALDGGHRWENEPPGRIKWGEIHVLTKISLHCIMICAWDKKYPLSHSKRPASTSQIRHFFPWILNCLYWAASLWFGWGIKRHLFMLLLLQNMLNSGEDNGDASVYEMMRAAGEWKTDGKWKEDKGKPVMLFLFFFSAGTSLCWVAVHFRPLNIFPLLMGTACSVASD